MSTIINADTSDGLKFTSDTSGEIKLQSAGTDTVTVDTSGNVGIGTSSQTYRLQIQDGLYTLLAGADSSSSSLTDATQKTMRLGVPHYTNAEEPMNLLYASSSSGDNVLSIGGGTSVLNALTRIAFYTAADTTTTSGAERMRIDSSGNVGIGTATATDRLTIANGSSQLRLVDSDDSTFCSFSYSSNMLGLRINSLTANHFFFRSTGELWIAGATDRGAYNLQCNGTGVWGAGAYVNGSDERIKENIASLDSGLDVVAKLNPVTYTYKEEWSKDQSTQTGFIAQELLTALDGKNYVDGIVQQGGEYMSVAYQNIIPILTKAIQEQQEQIKALETKIQALENA